MLSVSSAASAWNTSQSFLNDSTKECPKGFDVPAQRIGGTFQKLLISLYQVTVFKMSNPRALVCFVSFCNVVCTGLKWPSRLSLLQSEQWKGPDWLFRSVWGGFRMRLQGLVVRRECNSQPKRSVPEKLPSLTCPLTFFCCLCSHLFSHTLISPNGVMLNLYCVSSFLSLAFSHYCIYLNFYLNMFPPLWPQY